MSYSKTGPWTNGAAPGISAQFLNAIEGYLNPSVTNVGVPLCSKFGPLSITTTYTAFNHNLTDQNGNAQTPDIVLLVLHSTNANSIHQAYVDYTSFTTTQFKAGADASLTAYGIALKF